MISSEHSIQHSLRESLKNSGKYCEVCKVNTNKIKDLQKVVASHLQTISRLLQQSKGIRQEKSNIQMSKDTTIRDLQNKLAKATATIKKLQDNMNKQMNDFSILKKQQQQTVKLFEQEIARLKQKIYDKEKVNQKLQHLIEITTERLISMAKINTNFNIQDSFSISSFLNQLKAYGQNSHNTSFVSNSLNTSVSLSSINFTIKPLEKILAQVQLKYKQMNQSIIKFQKDVKNYQKKINQMQEKLSNAASKEKYLNDQIKILKEDVSRLKQSYNSMKQILQKSEEEKNILARKQEIQFQRIKKNLNGKLGIEELKHEKITLLLKIEQLQTKIKNLIKQNIQGKQLHLKQSQSMLAQIKKLQKQYQQQLQKRGQQSAISKASKRIK